MNRTDGFCKSFRPLRLFGLLTIFRLLTTFDQLATSTSTILNSIILDYHLGRAIKPDLDSRKSFVPIQNHLSRIINRESSIKSHLNSSIKSHLSRVINHIGYQPHRSSTTQVIGHTGHRPRVVNSRIIHQESSIESCLSRVTKDLSIKNHLIESHQSRPSRVVYQESSIESCLSRVVYWESPKIHLSRVIYRESSGIECKELILG